MPGRARKPIKTPSVFKRSVMLDGHRTSISLEHPFWDAVKDLARSRDQTIGALIESIDRERDTINLSSAIRLKVLEEARAGRLPLSETE